MRALLLSALFCLTCGTGASGQVITTVAGGGYPDGGSALDAPVGGPLGVAVDAQGRVFVAASRRILRLDPTGQIVVVAGNGLSAPLGDGGPATAAGLLTPAGVAIDTAGNDLQHHDEEPVGQSNLRLQNYF